jgi:hypothetical protein
VFERACSSERVRAVRAGVLKRIDAATQRRSDAATRRPSQTADALDRCDREWHYLGAFVMRGSCPRRERREMMLMSKINSAYRVIISVVAA